MLIKNASEHFSAALAVLAGAAAAVASGFCAAKQQRIVCAEIARRPSAQQCTQLVRRVVSSRAALGCLWFIIFAAARWRANVRYILVNTIYTSYIYIIYIFIRAPKWACDRDARRIVDPNCWCGGYKALTKPSRTRLIFVGRAAKTSIARCGVVLLLVRC